jgi:hypothetical protein
MAYNTDNAPSVAGDANLETKKGIFFGGEREGRFCELQLFATVVANEPANRFSHSARVND